LWKAVNDSNLEDVERLLSIKGIDLNSKETVQLLQKCFIMGYHVFKIIKKLRILCLGIYVQKSGRTTLMWAAGRGHNGIVKLLLAHDGIDVNAVGFFKNVSLFFRRKFCPFLYLMLFPVSCIKVLNKEPGQTAVEIYTALMLASMMGRQEAVRLLLAYPSIKINTQNNVRGYISFRLVNPVCSS
jgi:hypothetical protein